jgi:hypothetical protein
MSSGRSEDASGPRRQWSSPDWPACRREFGEEEMDSELARRRCRMEKAIGVMERKRPPASRETTEEQRIAILERAPKSRVEE